MKASNSAVLLLQCPERKGVVAALTSFLYQNNGNILQVDEHGDAELDLFMMRVEWEITGFRVPMESFADWFGDLAREFQMTWTVHLMRLVSPTGRSPASHSSTPPRNLSLLLERAGGGSALTRLSPSGRFSETEAFGASPLP